MAKIIQCPACRKVIYADRPPCPHCGHGAAASPPPPPPGGQPRPAAASGAQPAATPRRASRPARAPGAAPAGVPPEILGWNWGAFLLNFFWGIAHRVRPALLMVVPGINIFIAILLGARGNVLAWQAKPWESVAQFKRVQRQWARAGVIVLVLAVLVIPPAVYFGVGATFRNLEAYRLAMDRLRSHPEALDYLGEPIEAGRWVSGSFRTSGEAGSAALSVPVSGPRGEGTMRLAAARQNGQWQLHVLTLSLDGSDRQVDLLAPVKPVVRRTEATSR
ncbi:MAG: hypothetical protein H6842_10680 [Rhodospirillaceae bacterium]|nr:hypothetical protein [Rhodospirillaceae bacterium]